MTRGRHLFVGVLLSLAVSTLAGASTLTLTDGTLSVTVASLPPVAVPDNGAVPIFVSSGNGRFVEPAFVFGPTTVALPRSLFTGVPSISGFTLASFGNSTKTISCPGGACGGAGPVQGAAVVNVLQFFDLSIPLSVVGSPGATVMVTQGGVVITVTGSGWTTGSAQVTDITTATPGGSIVHTVTFVGSDNRTTGHGGPMTLVSPFRAITNFAGNLPGVAAQQLQFAPEPAEFLLLASGALCFGVYGGWRRLRRR